MRAIATLLRKHRPAGRLALAPLNSVSLRDQAYTLLKDAIASTDIYSEREPLRLDERELMQALGVSRTPVREALSILEQEGFVRTVPRRGIFIVRKSKREIDRKSTRLNSSHSQISYAVFCLKKKNINTP